MSQIEKDSTSKVSSEKKMEKEDKELIHRLNRAIGQLEAIKRRIESNNEKDCVQTIRLLKAANNAIKKFGEAYINEHLNQCINSGVSPKEIEKGLKDVVSSVFSMS